MPTPDRPTASSRTAAGVRAGRRLAVLPALLAAGLCGTCHAQAGPPMISNDPGTPGAGKWEINIAATGSRQAAGWSVSAPDLDINYGLGSRIQLSVHLPWEHGRDRSGAWMSGAGPVELAARWRFLDQDRAGVSVAVQPHWARAWSQSAIDHGLAPAGDEFSLPLQIAREWERGAVGMELGRNLIQRQPDEWQLGVYASHDCPHGIDCLVELNGVRTDGGGVATNLNLGMRRSLAPDLKLLASAGRQIGGNGDRQQLLFYLGLQLLR